VVVKCLTSLSANYNLRVRLCSVSSGPSSSAWPRTADGLSLRGVYPLAMRKLCISLPLLESSVCKRAVRSGGM